MRPVTQQQGRNKATGEHTPLPLLLLLLVLVLAPAALLVIVA